MDSITTRPHNFSPDGRRQPDQANTAPIAADRHDAEHRTEHQAPTPTLRLYSTEIRHLRRTPLLDEVRAQSYWWLVDADALELRNGAAALPTLPRWTRPLASIHPGDLGLEVDHGESAGDAARRRVRADAPTVDVAGPVLIACTGRVAGYGFDPLSVVWCHDLAGTVSAALAIVRNTYGGLHHYLVHPDDHGRAAVEKEFFVSPFHDVSGAYRLSVPPPGEEIHVGITLERDGAQPFAASVHGRRQKVTTTTLLALTLKRPLEPLATSVRIRVHGIRLWARRLPLFTVPEQDRGSGRHARRSDSASASASDSDSDSASASASGAERTNDTTTGTSSDTELHDRGPRRRGVPDVPSGPRAAVLGFGTQVLFRLAANRLPVRIEPAGGTPFGGGRNDPTAPRMILHRPADFAVRTGTDASIGFGEAFMAGDWSSPEPAELLTEFARELPSLIPRPIQSLRRLHLPGQPRRERGTVTGAAANISAHYDLSDDLFALFLDETMTYSSALFSDLPRRRGGAPEDRDTRDSATATDHPDLAAAQLEKIDALLDAAGVGPGSRVLEIGTGWGELCLRAAARGAQVRSITLSTAQRETATRRVAEAGYSSSIQVDVCDYRHVDGTYDAVVSVEMIEAVGLEHLPEYFRIIDRVLAPGGRVALQTILMDDDRVHTTRRNYTWVHKYVFPGGRIPSVESIDRALTGTRLQRTETTAFGLHYARTLRLWRDRFDTRHHDVATLGFDETFRRLWRFYLAYSEAGFRSGYLDVAQITLEANA